MRLQFSKKIWWLIFVIALIALGLFIYFFWSAQNRVPDEIKQNEGAKETIETSVSSVYRYDFKNKEYVADKGNSWQNATFVRYIYDLAPAGLKLDKCYYFFYDNLAQKVSLAGERRCNGNLTVTLGEGEACPSQGENACTLYIYAVDNYGWEGEMAAVTYHIDWQEPEVSQAVEKEGNLFQAQVSDNLKVNYCWLYFNQENVGSMEVKEDLAFLNYPTTEQSYTFWVTCADHYSPEREGYLNISSGKAGKSSISQNQAPEISSCKVSPAQGTRLTKFSFQVEVTDIDGDALTYTWNFGDGETSVEVKPQHYYQNTGTFEPKVTVSDGKKEVNCSTAWVVISLTND